ncbi:protease pro-enzyme activation domain-containing protein [Arthrobacter sp. ok362]|uniref:S53 family peptidase n=1 Tax=Arthrobacter sp. ok362 TaxID=1761745 RepID=UPI000888AC83|nr:S53 family peptidase [Arthrobacter sp. ok362]SDM09825.1 Pro-kumamolisin, activation domain [Arthrobacter sp. ok362]
MKKVATSHSRRATRLLALGTSLAFAIGLTATAGVAAPPTPPPSNNYPGSVPPWAGSRAKTGTPLSNTTVEGEIYLNLPDAGAAKAFATAVSTPGNPNYQQYLSPSDWIAKYGPAKADVTALVNYLKAQGMVVTSVPASGLYVVFRGTVSQINAAFSTTEQTYSFQGQSLIGPSSAPSLPANLAAKVQAISVDQGRLLTRPSLATPGGSSDLAQPSGKPVGPAPVDAPCSNYWEQNKVTVPAAYGSTSFGTGICGYTPSQLQGAYGVTSPSTAGAGQTVAIIDAYASPSIESDANTYSQKNGLPALKAGQYQQIVPDSRLFMDQALCGQPSGWQGEQTLDVEAVHGLAPAANILYVGGNNCGAGIDVAMSTILDKKLSNIVSNSYGYVGEAVSPNALMGMQNIHLQAAGEGVGLYFSSGDNGDEKASLGYASPDFPASSPFVTAVGGTSLAVGKNNDYLFETGWGTTRTRIVQNPDGSLSYAGAQPGAFRFGAGGGTSAVFAQPSYQQGTVPAALANGYRVSPDVASLADPYTGYQVGISPITNDHVLKTGSYETTQYGGTSLACPLTAAQMAIAQSATGKTVGFANPAIYAAAKTGNSGARDVAPQSSPQAMVFSSPVSGASYLVGTDNDTSLATAPGYDAVTGVGSMTVRFATSIAGQ